MSVELSASERTALRLQLHGRVQGLGVRPAVARLARALRLAGAVRNTLAGLEIDIEGPADGVAAFLVQLEGALPDACVIDGRTERRISVTNRRQFVIAHDSSEGPLTTSVPPDTAICRECLAEVQNPKCRRSDYALNSCAACGPRYSLIRQMPYERADTTLAEFPLCRECHTEYTSASDRRFHAQTTSCPECGPNIWAVDCCGRTIGARGAAVDAALAALRDGRIVALRGVGGYQLLCDASQDQTVIRLRERKHRAAKPLAVLVATLKEAEQIAIIDDTERRALADPANPIVLLRRRGTTSLAPSIHPGLNTVGVMLPTTAVHHQLARRFGHPLVCTSGNRDGEPLSFEPAAAERELAGIADLWLHHDRAIERPIDDSVVRIIAGRRVTIRLARGLAPLPLELTAGPPLLALGGHQKSAIAWCNGRQCALGPHVGDLETVQTRDRFLTHARSCENLYRFTPEAYVHDRHPDYFTTRWASQSPLPSLGVLHHHAHVAAGMLEHDLLAETVLGVAFDGTGLGDDHTIWGGEFLLAHGVSRMERVAHLRPFTLPGGEMAIREPWRVAVAVLQQAIGREALLKHGVEGITPNRIRTLLELMDRPQLNVVTTSVGRLFDAAACLILGINHAQFDGEPAMRLEDAADHADQLQYPLPLTQDVPRHLDWRPLLAAVWNDCCSHASPGAMAMRFHRALAAGIAGVVREFPGLPVVLGGGVFQNRLLTELVAAEFDGSRRLCLPGRIPPNDGGLAAGQLAIALAGLSND